MQCSTCGTPLPAGAAFCPTCGAVTPYNVSSSGVSPSDPTTVFTSYGESGASSQHAYPSLNPYAAPPTAPPPPPTRRRKLSAGRVVLLIVLVLLIAGGGAGGFLYLRTVSVSGQTQPHASPTARAQQATAIPSPQTPQELYAQITQGPPFLDDPLVMNGANNWTETTSADGKFRCVFSDGTYHASAQPKNSFMLCMAQSTNFGDLAYQVQMTIVKGEFGGMVLRADGSQTKYYSFFIDRYGIYTLITSVDNTGTHDHVLRTGTSEFIRTGLNQVNTLAVIARGSSLYLYINQQYITSARDTTYIAGQIGVFGGNYALAPADVVFSHAQVWNA